MSLLTFGALPRTDERVQNAAEQEKSIVCKGNTNPDYDYLCSLKNAPAQEKEEIPSSRAENAEMNALEDARKIAGGDEKTRKLVNTELILKSALQKRM